MAINIKGLEIETGKLYEEYTPKELSVLPPLDAESKKHWRLRYDGEWYHDDYDD